MPANGPQDLIRFYAMVFGAVGILWGAAMLLERIGEAEATAHLMHSIGSVKVNKELHNPILVVMPQRKK